MVGSGLCTKIKKASSFLLCSENGWKSWPQCCWYACVICINMSGQQRDTKSSTKMFCFYQVLSFWTSLVIETTTQERTGPQAIVSVTTCNCERTKPAFKKHHVGGNRNRQHLSPSSSFFHLFLFSFQDYFSLPFYLGTSMVLKHEQPSVLNSASVCQHLLTWVWKPAPVFLPGKPHGWRSLVWAIVHGVTKSQTRLNDCTFTNSLNLVCAEVNHSLEWHLVLL